MITNTYKISSSDATENEQPRIRKIKTLDSQLSDIGGVYFGPNQGIAFLYQKNVPGLDNIILSDSTFPIPLKLKSNSPVVYNEMEIGSIQTITTTPIDDKILVYFKYSNTNDKESIISELKENSNNYTAVPFVSASIVTCPLCEMSFKKNQDPCSCVGNSDYVIVSDVLLEKLNIYDIRKYDAHVADSKVRIYLEQFGGLINSMVVVDDI